MELDAPDRALGEAFLALYHAGYCAGAGLANDMPPRFAALIATVAAQHRVELVARGWSDDSTGVALPDWLNQLAAEIHMVDRASRAR